MESINLVLLITLSLTVASPPYVTKQYRKDYVYNRKTDAFYKLHIESSRQWQMKASCSVEGASPLAISSDHEVVQVHAMMKEYPDLGEFVWVANDGQTHESAEEQPIIDMNTSSNEVDARTCEVITRDGIVKSTYCFQSLPFVCKVDAKDAPYDERCGVYGRDYKYFASVNSCYKIPPEAYNWNKAYAECQAEGAHLVVINSETERAVVQNLTKSTDKIVGSSAAWFFFAGFRAQKTTGDTPRVFRTIFNQTLEEAGFAEWSEHEPNNWAGSEYCGSIFSNDGKLNDADCASTFGFICEQEVQT